MNLIRSTRQKLGLSTTELCYRLGVRQSTVVRLEQSEERGAITLASLQRIAEALHCTLHYELVPNKQPSVSKKKLPGRTRMARQPKRPASEVTRALKQDEAKLNRELSALQRIQQACALSDFAKQLQLCSKKQ